jgi:hypothetical protein
MQDLFVLAKFLLEELGVVRFGRLGLGHCW